MSEVQKLTGLSARTLQYYDDIGLLQVPRDKNGYRQYTEKSIHKLFTILFLKEYGINLSEIKKVIESDTDLVETVENEVRESIRVIQKKAELLKIVKEVGFESLDFQVFNPRDIHTEIDSVIYRIGKFNKKRNNTTVKEIRQFCQKEERK
ncbi:MAG: MerR family transcriptional regulator [Solobacterium sp.]|nr:MerR family transcriptional regulator [Solobacterium sp.]